MLSKVFYSWQSDLPNPTNRGFIQRALEDAAKSIRDDESIKVEPVVDRDTAGVPGAPDIASTIFDKIDQSDVFVCDVSIINQSAARPAPNPNVLLELGYAVKALGWNRIIMVLNTAFGGPELLPFDLRMRRVLPYSMPEEAEERAPERRKLQGVLAQGLRMIFEGIGGQMPGDLIRPATPAEPVGVMNFLNASDDEFEDYVVRLLSNKSDIEFNIIVEKLRDATVSVWELAGEAFGQVEQDRIMEIKKDFLPAMRKVTLLGLLLIKFDAPRPWFNKIADLLEEVFSTSHRLLRLVSETTRNSQPKSLEEQANHIVPAMESLIAAYLLGGYELSKRRGISYVSTLFPRVVDYVSNPYSPYNVSSEMFFLFWPITTEYWHPNKQRDLLVLERYGADERIQAFVGAEEAMKAALLQMDCLVDWHSFMSDKRTKEEATLEFFRQVFSEVSTWFIPSYTHERFDYIFPLTSRMWRAMRTGENNYFTLDERLRTVIDNLERDGREHLFARFLIYAQTEQRQWMFQLGRFPFDVFWPEEDIRNLVKELMDKDQTQH